LDSPREVPRAMLELLESQLDKYLAKSGDWSQVDFDANNIPPRVFWNTRSIDQELGFYAARILAIVPVGSNREGSQKIRESSHKDEKSLAR